MIPCVCCFPNRSKVFPAGGTRSQSLTALEEACSQEYPESAFCVRRFDDSLNSAIRTTYRIPLRSSSLPEPRYPLLRVVQHSVKSGLQRDGLYLKKRGFNSPIRDASEDLSLKGASKGAYLIALTQPLSRVRAELHSKDLTLAHPDEASPKFHSQYRFRGMAFLSRVAGCCQDLLAASPDKFPPK